MSRNTIIVFLFIVQFQQRLVLPLRVKLAVATAWRLLRLRMDVAACIKGGCECTDEQHAMSSHELQSAFMYYLLTYSWS
jgi:hypothetical protein